MLFRFIINILIGGDEMVVVYATLIINGRRTIESVPAKLKEAVKAELEALGLNQDGEPV